jgi:WD40 repeat protein
MLSALALLAAMPALAGPPGAVGDCYVTSDVEGTTRQYDGTTGAATGNTYWPNAATGQMSIHFNETNDRVVIGHVSGGVEEFDAVTGAYIKTYNPAGGWQWGALYAPNGNVYIGDWATNDVREYDSTTGALVGVLTTVDTPADMLIGPNGNLFICSYGGYYVKEVDANTGAFVDQWSVAFGDRVNDIAFLPTGEILVTAGGNVQQCYVFDASKTLLTTFTGTGWGRVHGIDISPWDGNIYIADGITTQVHVFDPVTFTELNPSWLTPWPAAKIVDVVFRPESEAPTAVESESWGGLKALFR